MLIYVVMAGVLVWRPTGLFAAAANERHALAARTPRG